MAKDCVKKLEEIFADALKDTLSTKEIKDVVEAISAARKAGGIDPISQTRAARKSINEFDKLKVAKKIERLGNINKITKSTNSIVELHAKDPVFGVVKTIELLDATKKGTQHRLMNWFISEARKSGVLEYFQYGNKMGKLDADIMQAVYELSSGGIKSKIPDDAVRAAKIVHKLNQKTLALMNDAGYQVKNLPGYIVRQSHDPIKINQMGMDNWKKLVLDTVDREKTFGDFANDEIKINNFLNDIYTDITTGRHDRVMRENLVDGFGANISKARVLHFKDGLSYYNYNRQAGPRSLGAAIFNSIQHTAKSVSAASILGTKPRDGLVALQNRLINAFKGNQKIVQNITNSATDMQRQLEEVIGSAHPGYSVASRVANAAKTFNNITLLGRAVISSIPDLGKAATALRDATGKSYLKAYTETVFNGLKLMSGARKREEAELLGIAADTYLMSSFGNNYVDDKFSSALNQVNRWTFKINGLSGHVSRLQGSVAVAMSKHVGAQAGKGFSELNERLLRTLKSHRINEIDWSVISLAQKEKSQFGDLLTPESIENIPNEKIKALGVVNVERYKRDLSSKYAAAITDYAQFSTGEIRPTVRALISGKGIVKEDSIASAIWGAIFQLKSFSINELVTAKRTLQSGDMGAIIHLAVGYTAMGYLTLALKDIVDGKEPRDPTSPEVFAESMVRGGVGGILGDLAFSTAQSDDAFSAIGKTMVGPSFSYSIDAIRAVSKLYDKDTGTIDIEKADQDLLKLGIRSFPFQNLFYVRPILNYLFLSKIQESLDPDHISKMEQRMYETPGIVNESQQFLFRPRGLEQ